MVSIDYGEYCKGGLVRTHVQCVSEAYFKAGQPLSHRVTSTLV